MINVFYDIAEGFGSAGISRYSLTLLDNLLLTGQVQIELGAGRGEYRKALRFSNRFSKLPTRFPSHLSSLFDQASVIGSSWCSKGMDSHRSLPAKLGRRLASIVALHGKRLARESAVIEISDQQIYHSLGGIIPKLVGRAGRVPKVATMYDLIPLSFWNSSESEKLQRGKTLKSITPETVVLAISQHTRKDFLEQTNHPPERCLVTYPGTDFEIFHPGDPTITSTFPLPDCPYFLTVCTLEDRKNLITVIRAFARFLETTDQKDSRLILIGGKAHLLKARIAELNLSTQVADQIVFPGRVSDADLAHLYRNATCFLFPSLYEGFGLPVVEAMSCGCPVLVANATSLRELVKSSDCLIEPLDVDAWANAMGKIALDTTLRQRLVHDGLVQAKVFTWESCAQETLKGYALASGSLSTA